jgi:glycine/D-amino acid oxidase-like deaminating enzyme
VAKDRECDVLVAGGGMGGVAAALAAAALGRDVVLTEETDWVGGQLTSQAVSCPDEHPWIEMFGGTRSYYRLREGVRDLYRRGYPLTPDARAEPHLNPGGGNVSRLCAEPRAWLYVLHQMLLPHQSAGRITVLLRHRPVAADVDADRVGAVTFADDRTATPRPCAPGTSSTRPSSAICSRSPAANTSAGPRGKATPASRTRFPARRSPTTSSRSRSAS